VGTGKAKRRTRSRPPRVMKSGGIGRQIGPSQPNQWLQLAVRYLARCDRTAAQVEHFLKDKGATPSQIKQTVNRLCELRYLDDRAYAQRWIESRLARKPMGRERLKVELLTRGITESLADRALREVLRGVDEEALARRTLKVKQGRGGRLAPVRAARLLRQRGFEEETIDRIIGSRGETTERDA
jgi:regulatory protein